MGQQLDGRRSESDSMGEVLLPDWAYWGAQTQRAVNNFQVSPLRIPGPMLRALALIKEHAARANASLGLLDKKLTDAIIAAAQQVKDGKWDQHFPIDVFQTGSGTSWNMNANEVIANVANVALGGAIGLRKPVHPNDHVNRCQSSNDVIPSALQVANRLSMPALLKACDHLASAFEDKAKELAKVLKLGRTHLQDAVPMTAGQEMQAFATNIRKAQLNLRDCLGELEELAIGGTAIGSGLNAHPDFAAKLCETLSADTGTPFRPAPDRFAAVATRDAQLRLAGGLNQLAAALMKIANDLRILASGPRGALGEIELPELQPGSSIMPGKVNPVILEMVIQAAAYVHGKALSIIFAAQNAPLQLNMMLPLLAHETLAAIELLTHICNTFADKAIHGLKADEQRMQYWIEWSLALVTPLALRIGYDKAAELAHHAFHSRKPIRQVIQESGLLSEAEISEVLAPQSMVRL